MLFVDYVLKFLLLLFKGFSKKLRLVFCQLMAALFLLSLLVSPLSVRAAMMPVDPCYSPLEMAALFSNMKRKPSFDEKITEKDKQYKAKDKLLDKVDEKISEIWNEDMFNILDADNLLFKCPCGVGTDEEYTIGIPKIDGRECCTDCGNCGNRDEVGKKAGKKDKLTTVAGLLSSYMDNEQTGWDCEKDDDGEWGRNMPCRDWQTAEDMIFQSKGKIDKRFCGEYTTNSSDCETFLRRLVSAYKQKRALKEQMEALETAVDDLREQKANAEIYGTSEEDESGTICTHCLADLRDLYKPSAGEIFGNVLTTGLGVGLSVLGVKAARRASDRTNELLALQGHPAQNNFGWSLAGANLGFPYIHRGIAGLTQSNASRGGFGCSPTSSPHGHPHPMMQQQYQMQQQQMMRQYQMQSMMGGNLPFFNPMAQFQVQMSPYGSPYGGSPYGSPFPNPMAQFQMQAGGNPFGALFGSPYGNPAFQFQMQGNPYGNPMAQFQMQGNPYGNPMMPGMNPMMPGMNPMMPGMNPMMPGMNPMFNQQSQYAMQQMQMQMQVQQAYMAQQMSMQQDQMKRYQVISGLMGEMQKIRMQINMVASGGVGSWPAGHTQIAGLTGTPGAPGSGPGHSSATPPPPSSSGSDSGDLPIIQSR